MTIERQFLRSLVWLGDNNNLRSRTIRVTQVQKHLLLNPESSYSLLGFNLPPLEPKYLFWLESGSYQCPFPLSITQMSNIHSWSVQWLFGDCHWLSGDFNIFVINWPYCTKKYCGRAWYCTITKIQMLHPLISCAFSCATKSEYENLIWNNSRYFWIRVSLVQIYAPPPPPPKKDFSKNDADKRSL